jgi:aminoglycoside phosphotransferase
MTMTTTRMTTTPTMVEPGAGDEAALLEAIAASLDRRLISHSQVSSEVSGEGLVVAHQVELETSDRARESHLVYVEHRTRRAEAANPDSDHRDGVLTMRDEDTGDQVAVWVYPHDPALPALEAAVVPDGADVILQRLGVDTGSGVTLKLEAYRPGKRAVVRVDTDHATVFLKVIAPGVAGTLAQRHGSWLEAGLPVPPVLGWSDEGLLALGALTGTPAVEALGRLHPQRFVEELSRLQERIARVPSTAPARSSLSSRLPWYERRLARAYPSLAAQVHQVARGIEHALSGAGVPPPVTVHGDLHVGQLFLNDATDAITGLLDIDTAGLGDPADDAAALYAHLIVTASINSGRQETAAGCQRISTRWRESWDEDPAFARRASAIAATHLIAHGLNHATDAQLLLEHAADLVTNIRRL